MAFVDVSAAETQIDLFDRSNNNGSIDVKMDESVLDEKSSFKILGLTFSSKLDWGSNSLPIECFPLTFDLSSFKSRIKRHLLTVGSF